MDLSPDDWPAEAKVMLAAFDAVIAALPTAGRRMQDEADRVLATEHASPYLRGYSLGYYCGLARARAVIGHMDNWIRMRAGT